MSTGARIGVDIKVELANAKKALSKAGKKLQMKEYLNLVGESLLTWVNKNFKEEGTEKKWAPLSPNTIIARRKKGTGAKILRDTGRMANSFVKKVSKSGEWVSVGTEDIKALWHHYGTKPYIITPKRKKWLRFPIATGGGEKGFRFAKEVHHPGLASRPLLPSKSAGRSLAVKELTNYVKVIVAEANRGKN